MRLVIAALIGSACLVAACSNDSTTAGSARRPPSTAPPQTGITTTTADTFPLGHGTAPNVPVDQLPLGRPGCSPPSPLGGWTGGQIAETRGTTTNGAQLFGLVMPGHGLPLRVGDQIKIVWRMTGNGPLVATATSPRDVPTPLVFGPDEHAGSSYHRPGDEWGVGYDFTEPGCWHLHFARNDTQGDVWFEVVTAR